MSDDEKKFFEEHLKARKTPHEPSCPVYQAASAEEKKASSGIVSKAYRDNYDTIFGKTPVGEA